MEAPRRKLVSFKKDGVAGLYALGEHRYEFRRNKNTASIVDTTRPSTEAERTELLSALEDALTGNRIMPDWHAEKLEIARYLRGLPVSAGVEHVISIVGDQKLYTVAEEPFQSSPDPDALEKAVLLNEHYRHVLYTPAARGHQQVAMCVHHIIPGEIHPDVDQYFLVKKGQGECIINGVHTKLRPLSAFWVERGQRHEIRADPKHGPLKLFVSYAPAHHPAGRIDKTNTDVIEWIES